MDVFTRLLTAWLRLPEAVGHAPKMKAQVSVLKPKPGSDIPHTIRSSGHAIVIVGPALAQCGEGLTVQGLPGGRVIEVALETGCLIHTEAGLLVSPY